MKEKIKAIRDTVWNGIAIGFFIPLLPLILVKFLMLKVVAFKELDLLLIGCIAINAILMNYCFKQNKDNIARGIISITFLWAFIFFFYKVL